VYTTSSTKLLKSAHWSDQESIHLMINNLFKIRIYRGFEHLG
jgi:hypothetical protein